MARLLDSRDVARTIARLGLEIVEAVPNAKLVGIHTGGVYLARRLARVIAQAEGRPPAVGALDITLYRDDLYTGLEKPILGDTTLPFEVDGAEIVLVDDVLFTGRTIRAGLDLIMDYGRPAHIKLAVLVDRGHRELPIQADFVGRTVETQKSDRVVVGLQEDGSPEDEVRVEPKAPRG